MFVRKASPHHPSKSPVAGPLGPRGQVSEGDFDPLGGTAEVLSTSTQDQGLLSLALPLCLFHLPLTRPQGDGNIRYYEISTEKPYLSYLMEFRSPAPQKGLGKGARAAGAVRCEGETGIRLLGHPPPLRWTNRLREPQLMGQSAQSRQVLPC